VIDRNGVALVAIVAVFISGHVALAYSWHPWALAGLVITVPAAVFLFSVHGMVQMVEKDVERMWEHG